MINGVVNIRKEPGMTSFGVVARIRRIIGQKKLGHAGTLDPDAEGVLPVCLGKATKLVELLQGGGKTYEAEMVLGIITDTQDTSGQVLEEHEVHVTQEEVRHALLTFEGTVDQIPPMYSAVKVGGKKLVDLARRGIEVERRARQVTFSDIEILKMDLPRVTFRVSCSKGAYIRTLCEDLGRKLGCGGAMSHLIRTRAGGFSIENAITIAEFEEKFVRAKETGDDMSSFIIPLPDFFPDCPVITVPDQFKNAAINGNSLPLTGTKPPEEGRRVRVFLTDGTFIGIYRRTGTKYALELYLNEL